MTGEPTPSLRIGYYIGLNSTDSGDRLHGRFESFFVYLYIIYTTAHHYIMMAVMYIGYNMYYTSVVVISRPGDKK